MSSRGGGGGDALGCLVLMLVFLPLWVVWKIIEFVGNHPDETIKFLTQVAMIVAGIVLAPHYMAAWLVLYLCRDWAISDWSWAASDESERTAIVAWLIIIPVMLAPAWFLLVSPLIASALSWGWSSLLSFLSTIVLISCYYWIYWNRQPPYPQWTRFEAQQQQMWFVIRSETAFRWLKLKLAWLDFTDEPK